MNTKNLILLILVALLLFSCKKVEKEYYEDGTLKKECELQDEKVIKCKFYSVNGLLTQESEYSNDKKNGKSTYYYDTGELKMEGNFDNDKMNGEFKQYYKDGKLEIKSHFKAGLKDGAFSEYYENGKIKSDQYFKMGLQDSTFRSFYENGMLEMDAVLYDGETYYYTKYDSLGNWKDEFRYIEINYKDTMVLGEKAKIKIKIHGPEVTGQDTNIVLFLDIYSDKLKNKKIDFMEQVKFLPLNSNDNSYSFIPSKEGLSAFSGLIITNPKNKKRKGHEIEHSFFYVVDSKKITNK